MASRDIGHGQATQRSTGKPRKETRGSRDRLCVENHHGKNRGKSAKTLYKCDILSIIIQSVYYTPVSSAHSRGLPQQLDACLPGYGLSSHGLSGRGLPGYGLSSHGLPSHGLPGRGLPGYGLSSHRLPSRGLPGRGLSGRGLPSQELPGHRLPGRGLPGCRQPPASDLSPGRCGL